VAALSRARWQLAVGRVAEFDRIKQDRPVAERKARSSVVRARPGTLYHRSSDRKLPGLVIVSVAPQVEPKGSDHGCLAALAAVNSAHTGHFAKVVEMICNDCKAECDKFPKITECKTCGESCKVCAAECRKAAA
jgi:hypothetical protein